MSIHICPSCKSEIPDHAPGKLCPSCALRGAEEDPRASVSTPPVEEIAEAFPELEVVSLIGQGGMGSVYQVRQPELDRVAALKILSPALSEDPAFAERFAREARVMGKLQHPHIVTIFESGESGGYFYLLMEYVDGVNLREAMQAGRFSPEQALAVVPEICDALQAAHSEGVLHRDIKPENILLDREGRVKIVDFGIARLMSDSERNFTLTMTGHALGSTAYMAPEQHEQPHKVDHRADIYSLGVVIYEMLTGELPLGRFPSPGERAAVNSRIDEIVLKTLEKERDLRQQSATEVKTDLAGVSSHKPEQVKERFVPENDSSSFFANPQKFFLTSLGLWLGGMMAVVIGFLLLPELVYQPPSPVIVGLGCLAAFFGLIGCGYILWQIRKERHPAKHRMPLLVLVFWPCVYAVIFLPIVSSLQRQEISDFHSTSPRLEPHNELLIYMVFAVIIPLVIARTFWRLFAKTTHELHFRKWLTLSASVIVIAVMLSRHFAKTRIYETQTNISSYVQLGGSDWSEDRPICEEAIASVIEDIPVKADLYAPHDPSLPEKLIKSKVGLLHLQWRSLNEEEADKTIDKFTDNIRASLPRRFRVSRSFVRNELKRKKLHGYSMFYIFPIFAPFVIVLLVTNGKKSEFVVVSMAALLTVGFVWKTSWPGAISNSLPLISDIDAVATIPEPEFDYSTTRDAVESYIKAAKQGDEAQFKAGLSPRLVSLVAKFEGDSSTLMNHWKSLSYGGRKSSDEKNMKVGAKDQSTGKKFEVNLVKWKGNWQVDSLLPIPVGVKPNVAVQQIIAAAKKGDRLTILNGLSDKALAKIRDLAEEQGYADQLTEAVGYLSNCTISSGEIDPYDSNKGWVDLKTTKKPLYTLRYEMVKERGHWRMTGETKLNP